MTSGTNYRWVTAVVAALLAGFLAAGLASRFVEGEALSWIIVVAVAVVVGAAVALVTHERTDDGAHIRDDVLGPKP